MSGSAKVSTRNAEDSLFFEAGARICARSMVLCNPGFESCEIRGCFFHEVFSFPNDMHVLESGKNKMRLSKDYLN